MLAAALPDVFPTASEAVLCAFFFVSVTLFSNFTKTAFYALFRMLPNCALAGVVIANARARAADNARILLCVIKNILMILVLSMIYECFPTTGRTFFLKDAVTVVSVVVKRQCNLWLVRKTKTRINIMSRVSATSFIDL